MTSVENSSPSPSPSSDEDHHRKNLVSHLVNHGEVETKLGICGEEVRGILEVIAATGKFWHDWDTLKRLLSFQLKQVLTEYPEAKMVGDQQNSSWGELFPELVKRLNEALLSFSEGPPFTLQRLCEILLTARSIYPNLPKLALALEKNLLVTSTLAVCVDLYPAAMIQKLDEPEKGNDRLRAQSNSVQTGVEALGADEDEIMAEAKEVEEDNKKREMVNQWSIRNKL